MYLKMKIVLFFLIASINGHAERNGDEIAFLMDGEENGNLSPFARVKLVRK